jgi:hypothetical protein
MSAHFNRRSRCGLAVALFVTSTGCGSTEESASGPVVPSGGPADPAVGDCPVEAPELACGQPGLAAIAVDQESVYYSVDGAIMKVPIQGGVPVTIVRITAPATAIAVHGKEVFWIDEDHGVADSGGTVHKVAITGGAPVLLGSTEHQPLDLAVDDDSVYWVDDSSVMKAPATGDGAPTELAPAHTALAIAVDGTSVYWTELYSGGDPLANDGRLMRVPREGGAAVVLASNQAHPVDVAVDAVSVYWTALGSMSAPLVLKGNGGVYKISIVGDTPVVPLVDGNTVSSFSAPSQIAINAEYVFWLGDAAGRASKIPIGGGTPEIVSDERSWHNIAVDSKQVYLIDSMTGTLSGVDP